MDSEQLAVNTIKALAMDGVQKANSGHPGMPMGMADLAVVLWSQFVQFDPTDPQWPDRDRFVLSNGHGSMLLYSLLHLGGYPLGLEDLQSFRQWGSITAGHPEREPHVGIEMTTGPLGQGFGTGVGLAIAEAHLRAVFGPELVDHRTYAFVSDGDLMEGVSSEAASIAGHLGLERLTYIYDDNEISIEGSTDLAFTEDVARRFEAMGWHTVDVDGHDRAAITDAIGAAVATPDQPSLVVAHTHIAHGAPNAHDTAEAHGAPLGEEEVRLTKEAMGWNPDAQFLVPDEVRAFFAEAAARGQAARRQWEQRQIDAFAADPTLAVRWRQYFEPGPVKVDPLDVTVGDSVATRKASGMVLNQIAAAVPNLVGGSADLAPSTNTLLKDSPDFQRGAYQGRNFRFGIREHGMGAAVNGMAIHGGLRPFGATFFVFNDYMRPATRLAALMGAPSIFVYTHDSVWLGEDGPTHQPIEQLASLRAMPNMWVVRPADATETAEAWELALNRREGPTCIILTRQGVPVLDRTGQEGLVQRGGYVLRDGNDAVLVATGSEVWVALAAADLLDADLRVVSLPCWEAFAVQDDEYRTAVLGDGLPIASLEAGATFGWERITSTSGLNIGIDHFGSSAPWQVIAGELGFTPDAVAARVQAWLQAL